MEKKLLYIILRNALILILGIVIFLIFFEIRIVHDISSYPSVRDGDLVLILKGRAYRGEIVAWKTPSGSVKLSRIAAVSGDTVSITEGYGYELNGSVPFEDEYYTTDPAEGSDVTYPYYVEDGYFLLNDYRTDSGDSRAYGAISEDKIIGKVFFLFRRRGF